MAGKRTMESGRTKKGKNFYFYKLIVVLFFVLAVAFVL